MSDARFLCMLIAVACSFPALATQGIPPGAPLVTDGPVVVDRTDFDAMLLAIPPENRVEVRTNPEHISTLIDSAFVSRKLAAKAREAGLDRDPAVQRRIQQLQERFLGELYLTSLEKEPTPDLEARARELYLAEKSKYVVPEEVHVEQVLVSLHGRTVEMARERAQKAYEEAKSGKEEFLASALRYSDEEPGDNRPRGDLGWSQPAKFVDPVREAIAKMKKGDISPPVQSKFGFHVLKLVDRKTERQLSFDEVKGRIITAERERLAADRKRAVVREIRSSPTAVVNKENVDALVMHIDPQVIKRAQEAASK